MELVVENTDLGVIYLQSDTFEHVEYAISL